MSRVFWDTNIFIYFFEDHARCLRERMLKRGDQLITSAMSVGEILVKPRERQDLNLCREYEAAITSTALVLPFDLNAARRFSVLRLDRSLRAPDAIQLACAATVGTDLFITNDNRLSGLTVEGVQFIVPLDRSPL
jgi:predicted nucleic acid-binding protein